MTHTSQFARHPDVESLNAFVENALPVAERESVVAHLAGCSRCREIAFLAQAASAEDVEEDSAAGVVAAATGERAGGLRRWWAGLGWGGWRPAVAAAGACAVLAGATLLMLPKHPAALRQQTQEAKSDAAAGTKAGRPEAGTPMAELSVSPPPRPAPPVPANSAAARPAASLPVGGRAGVGRSGVATLPMGQLQSVHASMGDVVASKAATPTPQPQLPGSASETVIVTSDAVSAQPQTPAMQAAVTQVTVNAEQVAVLPEAVSAKPAAPGSAERVQGVRANGALKQRAANSEAAAPYRVVGSATPQTARSAELDAHADNFGDDRLARAALTTLLPTGFYPAATAALRDRVVALDSAGTLYWSESAGRQWLPVTKQWSGQAATLRVAAPAGGAGQMSSTDKAADKAADRAAFSGAVAPARVPRPLFELVTDQGLTWTSEDGVLWKQRDKR